MTTRKILDLLARERLSYEQQAADAIAHGDSKLQREYYEGVAAGLHHAIIIIREQEEKK